MSKIYNTKDLWGFITGDMAKKANIKSIYSQSNFFKDLKRSNEELFINGILMDPILDQARNQIEVAHLAVKTICSAVERLKQNPDNFEHASEIIASIPELGTDAFETALLNAAELIELSPGPLAKAFQSFCATRSQILSLQRGVYSREKREEKYNQIKNKLEYVANLQIEISQIETRFLDKAANKIFNQLFEKKDNAELKDNFEQRHSEKEDTRKECLKKFLKLFLHQNFLFPNVNILNKLSEEDYIFTTPNKRRVELSYNDNGLFLQVSFLTQKVYDCKTRETLETQGNDFFVKGQASYKIDINTYNKRGWVAKFDCIDSSLNCEKKFEEILDKRSILEKFEEFLAMCLEKIIDYLSLNQSASTPKTRFKSIFFVSNSGNSVSNIILDDKEPCGNILDLTIKNMR